MDNSNDENSDNESWTSACDYFADLNDISSYNEELNNNENENSSSADTKIEIAIHNSDSITDINQDESWRQTSAPSSTTINCDDDDFHKELMRKRDFRKKLVQQKRLDYQHLRNELETQKVINKQLIDLLKSNNIDINVDDVELSNSKDEDATRVQSATETADSEASNEKQKTTNATLQKQLASLQLQLQLTNAEQIELTNELGALKAYIKSLKEVISASKEMIKVRDAQVDQMREKLDKIESSVAEREIKIMSDDLRSEYERQLANIRNLRLLYDERSRQQNLECENLRRQFQNKVNDLNAEISKSEQLEKDLQTANDKLLELQSELLDKANELSYSQAEKKEIESQMSVINQLFSQMLNNNGQNVNFDKLLEMLESNHGLLNEMTLNDSSMEGGNYLPKLLYDLTQNAVAVDDQSKDESQDAAKGSESNSNNIIAEKLPKVWRVLIELLSLQNVVQPVRIADNDKCEDCYKSIPTASGGTENVISVSKTFIKLKDLIIEKKSLQKETDRLKNLNCHLEKRLSSQEKRLSTVSLELTKTWHLVGKIQRQHRQLHTNEQVLRYQLQQKRRLLGELKDELEYCRKKWSSAKQKNNESEIQYKRLRMEHQQRKIDDLLLMSSNSPESGYSDEQISSSDDEHTLIHLNEICSSNLDNQPEENIVVNVLVPALHGQAVSSSTVAVESHVPETKKTEAINLDDVMSARTSKSIAVEKNVNKNSLSYGKKNKATVIANKIVPDKKSKHETAEEMFLRLTAPKVLLVDDSLTESAEIEDDDEQINDEDESQEPEVIEISASPIPESPSADATEDHESLKEIVESLPVELPPAIELQPSSSADTSNDNISEPSTSAAKSDKNILTDTEADYLARRDARLKRLEEQTQEFYKKMTGTVCRGAKMSSHLDDIHQGYMQREKQMEDKRSKSLDSPSTSSSQASENLTSKLDFISKRAERLENLELESKQLLERISETNNRTDEENIQTEQNAASTDTTVNPNISNADLVHQQDLDYLNNLMVANEDDPESDSPAPENSAIVDQPEDNNPCDN